MKLEKLIKNCLIFHSFIASLKNIKMKGLFCTKNFFNWNLYVLKLLFEKNKNKYF